MTNEQAKPVAPDTELPTPEQPANPYAGKPIRKTHVMRPSIRPTAAKGTRPKPPTKPKALVKPTPAVTEESFDEVPVSKLANSSNPLLVKLQKVRDVLNAMVFERQDETDGILLSVLAGTNTLFLGDVGTAKTFHIQTASTLLGMSDFDILMSETVKPDQIFGPTDIPALAMGKQQTKYVGYAPDCEILFFDEIFKANATVLNPLLWLINEHKFRDGDNGVIKCAVKAVFAASNELPTDPILKALYDRFLLRFNVTYLKDENNTRKLIDKFLGSPDECESMLTSAEVEQLRLMTREVVLPPEMRDLAMRIRRNVEYALNFKISDRRFLKSFRVMQASAVLNGRKVIDKLDLECLANIFWNEPAQITKVQSFVFSSTSSDTAELSTYLERANQIKDSIGKGGDLPAHNAELKALYKAVSGLSSRYAKQVAAEIKSIGLMFVHVIRERKSFRVIKTNVGTAMYKVAQSSASVWSSTELRAFGFRHKRKGNYWYTTNTLGTLKRNLASKNVSLIVSDLATTK